MSRTRTFPFAAMIGVFAWSMSGPASADDQAAAAACRGKQPGEACTVMTLVKPADGSELQRQSTAGTCQSAQCCDLDYSKGSPPETVCGPCLSCKAGTTPPIPPGLGEGDGTEPPRAADEPPASAGNDKRGCAVTGPRSRPVTDLLGALGLLLLGFSRSTWRRCRRVPRSATWRP